MKRVVITGMGVVSPIGNTLESFYDSLKAGRHGFVRIDDRFPESEVKVAALVKDFDPSKNIDKKSAKRMDLFTQYAVSAAVDAVNDAGTDFTDVDPYRAGIITGVGIGGLEHTCMEYGKLVEKGWSKVSVFYIPMTITNMSAGAIAIRLPQFKGANFTATSACASSTHAIGEAFRKIKDGYLDVCLAGGAESCASPLAFAGFNNMKALTNSDDPDCCSIPFDAMRDGFVLGEGAGMIVLEEYEHAKARGAKIYAEIAGYGATEDGYHITSPMPGGVAAGHAMRMAYEEAGLTAADIDYINAHGTSTGLNDKYETAAIKEALGEEQAHKVAINSTKSLTGHLLGAAGAVETIVTALACRDGFVHRTAGYKNPDPECDLDYVTEGNRSMTVNAALTNSLGFGGHNATLCIKKVI